ncbi:hypothetical protein Tco_0447437, partial [Tanacetum coccineum]
TDKELEMLFQPMFDEHLKQSRVDKPVPYAIEVIAQVVPPSTSLSTTIAQDAPSTSASSSTSDSHLPVQHQEIPEDTPIMRDVKIQEEVRREVLSFLEIDWLAGHPDIRKRLGHPVYFTAYYSS